MTLTTQTARSVDLVDMLAFDCQQSEGASLVGIDEAGRGPLAGPVVAAAVILPSGKEIPELHGLNDSKKLTARQREHLEQKIQEQALAYGIGSASAVEIDRINILQATFLAMRRALEDLDVVPQLALVDGNHDPKLGIPTRTVIKGDSLSASIAAASILAKTHRDRLMDLLGDECQDCWGFKTHKGYGTEYHRRALVVFGASVHHRHSFQPVPLHLEPGTPSAQFCDLWSQLHNTKTLDQLETITIEIQMAASILETNEAYLLSHRLAEKEDDIRRHLPHNKRKTGTLYESMALSFLGGKGYRLLERNFHSIAGEIDLILQDGETIVFVEVKMRKNDQYGSASETVTPLKKKRLALTAMDYLSRYAICPPCRFDVIAIEPDPQGATHLMHYENAFIFEEEGLQ